MESIIISSLGNFPIKFRIEKQGPIWAILGTIDVNGTCIETRVNPNFSDRIFIPEEMRSLINIPINATVMKCDLSGVIAERKRIIQKEKDRKYDGNMIDSGYGFMMKNTERNHMLCIKYGYDAIEKINN